MLRPTVTTRRLLLRLTTAAAALITATLLSTTPATSQTIGSDVSNNQDQQGDVLSSQTLNVVENDGLTSATGQATGNSLQGGNQDVDATLHSVQNVAGSIRAAANINGVNTGNEDTSLGTPVYGNTQAIGNYLASTSDQASLTATATQTASGPVQSATQIVAPNNAIYVSGEGDATAEANHAAFEVANGKLTSTMTQTSTSDVRADSYAQVHYSPSPNGYYAYATNNYYGAYSGDRGTQEHTVTQSQTGTTTARAEMNGGNVWQSDVKSTATGNNIDLQNQGGSLIVAANQTQSGQVNAQAKNTADQYSVAYATASGVGNNLAAGNNDVYVRLDTTQISSGGVDVSAQFDGNSGYDGYVTADAVGNQALAYACSNCQADYGVNSTQVNNSDVNATATASAVQGRSIVSTARATGNSATYYVSH
ncbi:MAG: holdfast anchor protein HfaD [Asticcacaulis sp.]|uniref:holdfast anchor protein HfaD n=1 Tax=Asticcacaulis sp. TaxID=1872648 RepID=UPI003F7B9EBE